VPVVNRGIKHKQTGEENYVHQDLSKWGNYSVEGQVSRPVGARAATNPRDDRQVSAAQSPPVSIPAFQEAVFVAHWGSFGWSGEAVNLPYALGQVYMLKGLTYDATEKDGKFFLGYRCGAIVPSTRTLADFKIPFALRSINRERDCDVGEVYSQEDNGALVVIQVDNAGDLTELEAPFCVGSIVLASAQPEFFQREKSTPGQYTIGLNNGGKVGARGPC